MSRRKRQAIEPGIRPWKGGLQGYIRVGGIQYAQDFPPDEPLEHIRAWREKTKGEHGGTIATPRGTFADDIDQYVRRVAAKTSIRQIAAHLELWARALGRDRSRHSIRTEEIDAIMQEWLCTPTTPAPGPHGGRPSGADGVAPATVQKRRSTLRSFFRVMNGKAGANPVRASQSFRPGKPEARGTDYATIARILAAMPDYHTPRRGQLPTVLSLSKLRAAVIAYTGIPPGILGTLTRADLCFTTPATVRIPERVKGAGVEARTIPLTAEGRAAFRAFDQANAYGTFPTSPLNLVFQRACARVGVHGLTLYDLRHSFGAQVYRTTRDLATVSRLLLHAEGSVITARYAKAAHAAVDVAAVAAFSASLQPKTGLKLSPKAVPIRKALKGKHILRAV